MKIREDRCQSCGTPISNDMGGGGTNIDESKNYDYFSLCYVNRKFMHPGPIEDFQEFCKIRMTIADHSNFKSWFLTRGMKRLKRWHQSDVE